MPAPGSDVLEPVKAVAIIVPGISVVRGLALDRSLAVGGAGKCMQDPVAGKISSPSPDPRLPTVAGLLSIGLYPLATATDPCPSSNPV